MLKTAFDIETGKAWHIDELPPERSGKRCNCRCPECNEPMIARRGLKNDHSFAHFPDSDKKGECPTAAETALHKMAKEVLLAAESFTMPDLYHGTAWYDPYTKELETDTKLLQGSLEVKLLGVKSEQRIEDVIPDAVLTYRHSTGKEDRVIVAIWVAHKVDSEKLKKIKRIGLPII